MDETIYYVCKYTPLELIVGFGLSVRRLDPAPASFECAESCTHPNLCGYGKAVLEEVLRRGIQRLILVDCCDVCRRLYDVLRAKGGMEFLFRMSLPHKNGPAECELLARELNRLSCALGELTGQAQDKASVIDAWVANREAVPAKAPYILLTGAHGGSVLMDVFKRSAMLPIIDNTCTGQRVLQPFNTQGTEPFSIQYARALLNQRHPCMRMQFGEAAFDEGAAGIICHTVKFCDFYGFQYRRLKENTRQIVLKIETDCTPQSSGQLRTRIEAFCETLGVREMEDIRTTAGYVAGVDSGSASTDAVILDHAGRIVGSAILSTGAGAAVSAQKALDMALRNANLTRDQVRRVVTTGYGRDTIGQGDAAVTEITCHALGAHRLHPAARTVIDIGGQDSKVILLDENGHITSFAMNDKCAAGTGRFLEMMSQTMELSLPEMSKLGLRWKRDVSISSMCTVFAESEVVSLIAENTKPEDIIHGLNVAVAARTAALINRVGGKPPYIMTGGVAQNRGVVQALEEKLREEIIIPKEAQLCGALGAALLALRKN